MCRNLTVVLFIAFLLPDIFGQTKPVVKNPEQYMFPEFYVGVVRLKTGEKIALKLNYNVASEKMVFMQKDQIFDMTDYEKVDTIYIQKRKFVPVNKVFYEVLVKDPVALFMQHRGTVVAPSRPAAYGGTSQVSSSTYINNLSMGNDVFRMKNKQEIMIDPDPALWIRKDNVMHQVIKKNDLIKIFQDKAGEIKEYIRKYRVNPENPDHIIGLIKYYNGLSR